MIFHLREPYVIAQSSPRRAAAQVRVGELYSCDKELQASLIWLGYDLGDSGADGVMGTKTKAAIIAFKKEHGESPADATITKELMKNLIAAVAAKPAPSTESTPAPAPAPSGMTAAPATGVSTGGIVIAFVAVLVVGVGIFLVR